MSERLLQHKLPPRNIYQSLAYPGGSGDLALVRHWQYQQCLWPIRTQQRHLITRTLNSALSSKLHSDCGISTHSERKIKEKFLEWGITLPRPCGGSRICRLVGGAVGWPPSPSVASNDLARRFMRATTGGQILNRGGTAPWLPYRVASA